MTLEALFARAAQGRAFLMLAAGGAALGLLLQLSGWLYLRRRWAGMAADALCAMLGTALAFAVSLWSGSGLRGYAALGLLTGLLLYRAGVQRLLEAAMRRGEKLFRRRQECGLPVQNLHTTTAGKK